MTVTTTVPGTAAPAPAPEGQQAPGENPAAEPQATVTETHTMTVTATVTATPGQGGQAHGGPVEAGIPYSEPTAAAVAPTQESPSLAGGEQEDTGAQAGVAGE
ncbi:hypothetical protein [Corynebacterium oculi]|uniref:Uncharacterized protein n=1 Tax=Corynebacterium oculi TaxID=1544416 RepID=A0A0Q0U938_9CORY|nr:hypothetical protein [Corynebacterium oculi]KQB84224.1 hypothetical protein Cocul_01021 [Corynebacterium oculi]